MYRAYVKAAGKDSGTTCTSSNKRQWCRENYLNHARLITAVKVRAQLKGIVKGSGLGSLQSCGADDFTPLNKAFFEVAFRDQVATLSVSRVEASAASNRSSFPYYTRLNADSAEDKSSALLSIHPDSSLYATAVIARSPPPAVLFVEAVEAGSSDPELSDGVPAHKRVLLRHVCPIPVEWLGGQEAEEGVSVIRKRRHTDTEAELGDKCDKVTKKPKLLEVMASDQASTGSPPSLQSPVTKSKGQKRREKKRLRNLCLSAASG